MTLNLVETSVVTSRLSVLYGANLFIYKLLLAMYCTEWRWV